jgi:hypothetical protein
MHGYHAGNRWIHVYQRTESGEKYIMKFKAATLIEAVLKFETLYFRSK